MGAGQENAPSKGLWAIVGLGVVLTGAIVYSCATDTVDLGAPTIPEILRRLEPAPPAAASPPPPAAAAAAP